MGRVSAAVIGGRRQSTALVAARGVLSSPAARAGRQRGSISLFVFTTGWVCADPLNFAAEEGAQRQRAQIGGLPTGDGFLPWSAVRATQPGTALKHCNSTARSIPMGKAEARTRPDSIRLPAEFPVLPVLMLLNCLGNGVFVPFSCAAWRSHLRFAENRSCRRDAVAHSPVDGGPGDLFPPSSDRMAAGLHPIAAAPLSGGSAIGWSSASERVFFEAACSLGAVLAPGGGPAAAARTGRAGLWEHSLSSTRPKELSAMPSVQSHRRGRPVRDRRVRPGRADRRPRWAPCAVLVRRRPHTGVRVLLRRRHRGQRLSPRGPALP